MRMERLVATALWGNLADLSLSAGTCLGLGLGLGSGRPPSLACRPLSLSAGALCLARRRVGGRLHRGTLPDVSPWP